MSYSTYLIHGDDVIDDHECIIEGNKIYCNNLWCNFLEEAPLGDISILIEIHKEYHADQI